MAKSVLYLANTICKFPEDDSEAPKHVGVYVIWYCNYIYVHLLVPIIIVLKLA